MTTPAPELTPDTDAADPLHALLRLLDLETIGDNRFRGFSATGGWARVYGGQVLAQALVAADRTVDDARPIHSLHAYFLSPGRPEQPIDYDVERLRDGGSFTTRRVTALQAGAPIFSMIASFHKLEEGFSHASVMPDVPPPEQSVPISDVFENASVGVPETMRAYYRRRRPFDLRLVDPSRFYGARNLPARQCFWLKARGEVAGGAGLHAALLAFASDFAMIDTVLIAHGRVMFDPKLQLASLDHALWFHQPVQADAWLLYVLDSPAAGQGRGFTRGAFFTQDGRLVASAAQEGLVRERATAFVIK